MTRNLKYSLLLSMFILFQYQSVTGQERNLNPERLNRIIRVHPDRLRVSSVNENLLNTIDTVSQTQITLKPDQLKAIRLGDQVTAADRKVGEYMIRDTLHNGNIPAESKSSANRFRVIPELYLLPGRTEPEDISFYVYFTSEYPLQYDFGKQSFTGSLDFILLPENAEHAANPSIRSILVEVVSRDIETIKPNHIEINHLSLPSSEILLSGRSLVDSAMIRIRTRLNPEGYMSYMYIESPLSIKAQKKTIQGYGIQEVPVTVTLRGKGESGKMNIDFGFERGKGSLSPESLQLNNNESATIMVRSEGTGDVLLKAFTPYFTSNPVGFTYLFPISFLAFALFGGLVGAGLKFMRGRKTFAFRTFTGSVLIGLLAVGLWYVLGINLLKFTLPDIYNEASVFFISALAAWGIGLIIK